MSGPSTTSQASRDNPPPVPAIVIGASAPPPAAMVFCRDPRAFVPLQIGFSPSYMIPPGQPHFPWVPPTLIAAPPPPGGVPGPAPLIPVISLPSPTSRAFVTPSAFTDKSKVSSDSSKDSASTSPPELTARRSTEADDSSGASRETINSPENEEHRNKMGSPTLSTVSSRTTCSLTRKRKRSASVSELKFFKKLDGSDFNGTYIRMWMNSKNMIFYDCSCGKRKPVQDLSKIRKHAKSHEGKPHICSICGRKFERHLQLNGHMKIHKKPSIWDASNTEVYTSLNGALTQVPIQIPMASYPNVFAPMVQYSSEVNPAAIVPMHAPPMVVGIPSAPVPAAPVSSSFDLASPSATTSPEEKKQVDS